MTVARLRLLGGFALESSGVAIDLPFGVQRLVAFVALHRSAHRHVVAGALWPEVPEAHALASLRTTVWRINKAVPGLIHATGPALDLDHDTLVDSREQEAFAAKLLRDHIDDPEWIGGRLEVLWAGELLPGWYDDWVVFERERLSQLRLHALERSARALIGVDIERSLELALEAVRAEPLRESANAVLMAVFVAEGNVTDAMRQYELYERLLDTELRLEPSPRLIAVLPPRVRHAFRRRVDTTVTALGG
jgi:DNA-binding SARP family transcriptional activator